MKAEFIARARHEIWHAPHRANISQTVLVLLTNEQGEKEKGRDEREFSWCCSFLWGFGCRCTAAAKAGADPVLASPPDPEVHAKAKRHTFTAEYKLRILQEAEAVADRRGGIGTLLRREG
jgi:hypothetical protein